MVGPAQPSQITTGCRGRRTDYLDAMSERQEPEPSAEQAKPKPPASEPRPKEIGGPKGPEPTRYGDWEVNGRCSDF